MDQLTRRGGSEKPDSGVHMKTNSLAPKRAQNRWRFIRGIAYRRLIVFICTWILTLWFYERVQVRHNLTRCSKALDPHSHLISLWLDPQLVDDYSYPGRPEVINSWAKKFTDNYLHRNYMLHKEVLNPDTVLFLGDLFDGGREWEDPVWYEEFRRFNKVFPKFEDTRVDMSLPGNHDIGFGNDVNITKLNRFRTFFGESNHYTIVSGFAIVMIDTISLSSRDPDVRAEPMLFLQKLSNGDHEIHNYKTILITHVPLYRFTDRQKCGPLRESKKKFPVMKGKQYQTVLEHELSQQLLQAINPVIIFSGDDHDYCDVTHSYLHNGENKQAREITIKSVAMSAGIRYPALQLLTLDLDSQTYDTNICYLPTPSTTLKVYSLLLISQIIILAIVLLTPDFARTLNLRYSNLIPSHKLLPLSKDDKASNSLLNKILLLTKNWNIPETKSPKLFALNLSLLLFIFWYLLTWTFTHI